MIEKELGCKFIRIYPDAENYDIFVEIGKIHNHIIESTKKLTQKSTEKSLFHKISKKTIKTRPKENHSMKSKCLKFIVIKTLTSL